MDKYVDSGDYCVSFLPKREDTTEETETTDYVVNLDLRPRYAMCK